MMHSAGYLKTMGISVWRLRKSVTPQSYRIVFYNEVSHQPIGLMLADRCLANAAEKQLVEAIAKATKLKFVFDVTTEILSASVADSPVLILLGDQVKTQVMTLMPQRPIMASYSPAELLANEKLKAHTWESIKKAMQIMVSKSAS